MERNQSEYQHGTEDFLGFDVRGQNDLAVRRVDMKFVDVGHAFVVHGCRFGRIKALMEGVVLSIFFADLNGSQDWLRCRIYVPRMGLQTAPRIVPYALREASEMRSP